MKTAVSIALMVLVGTLALNPAFAIAKGPLHGTEDGTHGAPNSGDSISDGSGWDPDDHGAPNSGDGIPNGTGVATQGAPNSGDGISDGSGWDSDDLGASSFYSPFPIILFVR